MDTELKHYGILGMKWGIRRTERQLARARGRVTELEQELERKTGGKILSSNGKPKTINEMTDSELQQVVNRLNLERRYNELVPEDVSRGKRFFKSLGNDVLIPGLKSAGKTVATAAFTKVMEDAVTKATGIEFKKDKKDKSDKS